MSKYYWLKLNKDFFKRHDIRIIESMQNGKDYILFYLKMLVESVSHEGELRFSDTIPYNEEMLATITNTNVDIVRSALKVFTELQMMEILDDQTIFMSEVQKMIGCETDWAKKKREYREKTRTLSLECPADVRQEIEIDSDIDKELDKEIERDTDAAFIPPTLDQISEYIRRNHLIVNGAKWYAHYKSKDWMIGNVPMTDWKASLLYWDSTDRDRKQKKSFGSGMLRQDYDIESLEKELTKMPPA